MNADTVMNVRSFHDLRFQTADIFHLYPQIRSHSFRSVHTLCPAQKKRILSIVPVKPAEGYISMLCFCRNASRIIKSQRIGKLRFLLRHRCRPGTAVLQKLPVFQVRVADSPVGKKASGVIQDSRLCQKRGNCAVDIRLADHRNPLFI